MCLVAKRNHEQKQKSLSTDTLKGNLNMKQKKAHSEEYFNDSRNFWWNQDFVELISKRCHFNSVGKALDVGAGQGHWIQTLLPFFPSESELIAVEPEETSRMIGNKRLQGRVEFVNGTAEKLPFPDNHFDLVTCQTVLIHVSDPLIALKEMLRVLKPGGLILAVEPNNLFGELVRDSLSHVTSIEEQLESLKFVLRCHQGKAKLGEGERNRGDFLVQYFLKCGVEDVSNCLSDKTSPIYAPYEKPEQKAIIQALKEAYKSRQFYWAEDETKRFFLAEGGSEEEFQEQWARLENHLSTILQEIEKGRYYSPGPCLMYLVWGRKSETSGS
jgi:ubiquinone/menaquinone biosynthesis C-methylase UbiE